MLILVQPRKHLHMAADWDIKHNIREQIFNILDHLTLVLSDKGLSNSSVPLKTSPLLLAILTSIS